MVSDTFKWPNGEQGRLPFRRSVIVSREGRPYNFDIVNPLSKSKGAETEHLNLFFVWLGVFYLLAVGIDAMLWSKVLYRAS